MAFSPGVGAGNYGFQPSPPVGEKPWRLPAGHGFCGKYPLTR